MRALLQLVSWLSLLGGIVAPPLLFLSGSLGEEMLKTGMLAGTILWFATAPLWMNQDQGA